MKNHFMNKTGLSAWLLYFKYNQKNHEKLMLKCQLWMVNFHLKSSDGGIFCFHSEVTYPIHVEAINTLLVMLSVQMFDPNASESSIFFQVVMKGKW